MRVFVGFFLVWSVLAVPGVGAARDLSVEQKLSDFRFFTSVIESGYGPFEYKQANGIVAFAELNRRFADEIAATKTNIDFYYKMMEYVASYRDGHFAIVVPSDKKATVPVQTDLVDGKILITKIDREKLKQESFPFQTGDEVVTVDGVAAADFLDAQSRYVASGNPASIRRFAAWSVFWRAAQRMPLPKVKAISVEVRRGTSDVIESAKIDWTFEGQDIEQPTPEIRPFGTGGERGIFSSPGAADFGMLRNDSLTAYAHPMSLDFICSGETRVDIPKDATIIKKKPFVAYYHSTAKGNVGYLRIPHYYPPAQPGRTQLETVLEWMSHYEFAVRELEKNTVGLIIDQDHNCGGSVWVVNKSIAMFMDRPFVPSQFELLANKETYLGYRKYVNDAAEGTIERSNAERVLKLIEETWQRGTSFLTAKISIDGEETVEPSHVRYTKPVVILVDEIAGSGGDMFPAMMKGLGRAKLFGQTTSGLGGHVEGYPAGLPFSQLKFRMTKSLFYRPDGVAIENNGAVPDRFYAPTRDDILYGFKGYQREYVNYLLSLID